MDTGCFIQVERLERSVAMERLEPPAVSSERAIERLERLELIRFRNVGVTYTGCQYSRTCPVPGENAGP